MTSPFSWSDTVKIAFISCLPCLKLNSDQHSEHENQPHNPTINRIPRARPDELQGLLADVDTDVDAETLSLHFNPGRSKRNKKKKRTKRHDNPRRITFFGYNLFGRPIQLPDEDDALYNRGNGNLTPSTAITAHSTSTFDSDAAPLDSDTIAALSSSNITAAAQSSADVEAQRLKEKEERRQRRREKNGLKRLGESMAAQGIIGDGDVFEGFQGSGGFVAPLLCKDHPRIPSATFSGSNSGSGSAVSGSAQEYGRFVAAPGQYFPQPEDDHDDADLDGGVYARKKHVGKGSHGSSDSRSRISTLTANREPQQALPNPNINDSAQSQAPSSQPQLGRKRNSRTSATTGTSTASRSPSLPSPISPSFPSGIISPSTVEHGQGFFDVEDSVGPSIQDDVKKPAGEFPASKLGGEFPMTGFRGLTGVGVKGSRDLGAFLAIRGDEDNLKINGL
jgi:hypothetical protein